MKKLLCVLLALALCALCVVPAIAADADPATCKHQWKWVTDQAPTCGETGLKHEACDKCGSVQNENTVIPATEAHVYQWVVDAEPTCGVPGVKHEICQNCGKLMSENTPIPATEAHTWSAEPTATEPPKGCVDGYRRYTCTACGQTKEEAIPAGQAHEWEWVVVDNPGANVGGTKYQVCKNCGTVQNMNTPIPPVPGDRHIDNALLKAFDDFIAFIRNVFDQIKALFTPSR